MLIPMEEPRPQPLSFRSPKQGQARPSPCCITPGPSWLGRRQRRLGMVLPVPATPFPCPGGSSQAQV